MYDYGSASANKAHYGQVNSMWSCPQLPMCSITLQAIEYMVNWG